MSVESGGEVKESKILKIVAERPWLLLILDRVLDLSGDRFTAKDIAEHLGLRSYIVQRALWWLKKYGFVEEISGTVPRKYRVKTVEDPLVDKLKMNRWVCGNTTVYRLDDTYVVLINRGDNIVARVIHRNVVDAIKEAMDRLGLGEDAVKISQATGHDIATVKTAIRVWKTIFCKLDKGQQS